MTWQTKLSKMVNKSIKSFVKKDIEMARNVIVYDDVVDNYFEEIKKELIRIIFFRRK